MKEKQTSKTNEEMYNEIYAYYEKEAKESGEYTAEFKLKFPYSVNRFTDEKEDLIKKTFDLANRTAQDLLDCYKFMWETVAGRIMDEAEKEDTDEFYKSILVDDIIDHVCHVLLGEIEEKDPVLYEEYFKEEFIMEAEG